MRQVVEGVNKNESETNTIGRNWKKHGFSRFFVVKIIKLTSEHEKERTFS